MPRKKQSKATCPEDQRESGEPGGGTGRKDIIEQQSGVRPMSAGTRPDGKAEVRDQMSWGQGKRGAEGYWDAGQSELSITPEEAEALEKAAKKKDEDRSA